MVFCRRRQRFLAFILLLSICAGTPHIQQVPKRAQPLLKSITAKRRKINRFCIQAITSLAVGKFHVFLVLFLHWREAVSYSQTQPCMLKCVATGRPVFSVITADVICDFWVSCQHECWVCLYIWVGVQCAGNNPYAPHARIQIPSGYSRVL